MRQYFYHDSTGKLRKFVHCIRGCSESYRQEEIGVKIFKANDMTYLCSRCIKELKLSDTITLKSTQTINLNTTQTFDFKEQPKDVELQQSKKDNNENLTIETKDDAAFYGIVVQCKDKTYYVGVTSNIEKAIKNHNSGCGSVYTKPKERRPVKLIVYKGATSFDEAKKIKEKFQKKYINK